MSAQMLPLASAAQGNSKEFRLEMKGMLPPWILARICRVLNAAQQGNYQVSTFSSRGCPQRKLLMPLCYAMLTISWVGYLREGPSNMSSKSCMLWSPPCAGHSVAAKSGLSAAVDCLGTNPGVDLHHTCVQVYYETHSLSSNLNLAGQESKLPEKQQDK